MTLPVQRSEVARGDRFEPVAAPPPPSSPPPPSAPPPFVAVQLTPQVSSEVAVFRSLVASGPFGSHATVHLVQGVDPSRPSGTDAAEAFESLSGVSVERVGIGGLGRDGTGLWRRGIKVLDAVASRRQERHMGERSARHRPAFVYSSQQHWDQAMAARLARRLGVPRVVHLHYTVGPWLRRSGLANLASADAVITVSDFIREQAVLGGLDPSRVHTLHNTMLPAPRPATRGALRRELRLGADAVLIGMTARLSETKCQSELVRALAALMRDDSRVILVLAGEEWPAGNGLRDRLASLAAGLGIGDRVHIVGFRTDVGALLDDFDIFAHPTRQEPCALAVLEAMSHGLPVVGWDEGGTPELVGGAGRLVPTDDMEALGRAFGDLVSSPEQRRALGAMARTRIEEHFAPAAAAARFADLLETVRVEAGRPAGGRTESRRQS